MTDVEIRKKLLNRREGCHAVLYPCGGVFCSTCNAREETEQKFNKEHPKCVPYTGPGSLGSAHQLAAFFALEDKAAENKKGSQS